MPNRINKIEPYNPLDKHNLGANVAGKLVETTVHQLPPEKFIGAGVYAIYYNGQFNDFEPYKRLSELNRDNYTTPIYIGKAVPPGSRKGGLGINTDHGLALYNRLFEHYISIVKARNLDERNFVCRYLVVDEIWIPLAEAMLITQFKPLWNLCIDGFGNHDPGKGRYKQQRSPWDCIHEGREWADKLEQNTIPRADLIKRVVQYLNDL